MALPVVDQPIQAELGRAFHQRVGLLAQKTAIAAEGIMLPQVLAQPGARHRPIGPHRVALAKIAHRRGLAPQIGVVVRHQPLRRIIDRGRFARHSGQLADQIEQRLWHSARLQFPPANNSSGY